MKKLRVQYPSKTTLNLAIKERTINSPSRAIPLFLGVLLLIGIACKFLVLDQLGKVWQARAALLAREQELSAVNATLADYDSVAEQYSHYSYQDLTEEERALADRKAALDLLQNKVMQRAAVQNVAVRGQTMSLTLFGVTLKETSRLVADLESDPIVAAVDVYTAGSADTKKDADKPLQVTMTITLTAEKGGES